MKYPTYKTGEEARRRTRKTRMAWLIYFVLVIAYTFLPLLYPYHVVHPTILGIPVHLFKWFISTLLLIGGILAFELTTFWKLRGDDR